MEISLLQSRPEAITVLMSKALRIAPRQSTVFREELADIVGQLQELMDGIDEPQSESARKMASAQAYIKDHFRDVKGEDVADALFMSYSRFRKLFKQEVGVSPACYIMDERISRAKERLASSSQPIKEIAFDVGFDNKDYFSTVFKRLTGMTPSAWREQSWKARLNE